MGEIVLRRLPLGWRRLPRRGERRR